MTIHAAGPYEPIRGAGARDWPLERLYAAIEARRYGARFFSQRLPSRFVPLVWRGRVSLFLDRARS